MKTVVVQSFAVVVQSFAVSDFQTFAEKSRPVPTAEFSWEPLFQTGADQTTYRLLTKEHVQVRSFQGQDVLCVDPAALTLLSSQAFHDINFFCVRRTCSRLRLFLTIPRHRRMTAWWL